MTLGLSSFYFVLQTCLIYVQDGAYNATEVTAVFKIQSPGTLLHCWWKCGLV